ncbi:hypothetical protein IJ670_02365, partial [bacterium]|nr:hypothetical protein [bacterium]
MKNVDFINQYFINKIPKNNYLSVPKTLSFKGNEDFDEINKRKKMFSLMFQKELEEKKTVQDWDIDMLCQMDYQNALKTAEMMKKYNTNTFGAEVILGIPKDKKEKAFSYLDENIPVKYLKFMLNLEDETSIQRAKELIQISDFTPFDIVRFIRLKEEDYKICLEFLKANHGNVEEALALACFKGEKSQKALELVKKGFRCDEVRKITNQDEASFKRALEMAEIKGLEKRKIPSLIALEKIKQETSKTPF